MAHDQEPTGSLPAEPERIAIRHPGDGRFEHAQTLRFRRNRRVAVGWLANRHHVHHVQVDQVGQFYRDTQVTVVHRIEGSTQDPDDVHEKTRSGPTERVPSARGQTAINAMRSCAHVPVSKHDKFLRREAFDPNRPARVDLVGGDAGEVRVVDVDLGRPRHA